MDLLVVVCVLVSIISGIIALIYIEECTTVLLTSIAIFLGSVTAAICISNVILHSPYTHVELGNGQIVRYYQSVYFSEPVAVFPVKAYKENCVSSNEITIIFPDTVSIEPSPDEVLAILQK